MLSTHGHCPVPSANLPHSSNVYHFFLIIKIKLNPKKVTISWKAVCFVFFFGKIYTDLKECKQNNTLCPMRLPWGLATINHAKRPLSSASGPFTWPALRLLGPLRTSCEVTTWQCGMQEEHWTRDQSSSDCPTWQVNKSEPMLCRRFIKPYL